MEKWEKEIRERLEKKLSDKIFDMWDFEISKEEWINRLVCFIAGYKKGEFKNNSPEEIWKGLN